MEYNQTFGQYIRSLRLTKKLKQTDLSEQADIKSTYLSKIENDKSDPPSEEMLIRMAIVLGENPYRMLVRAGKVPSDFQHVIVNDDEAFHYLEEKAKRIVKAE